MIYLIGYFIIALIAIPILGRWFVKYSHNASDYDYNYVSPTWLGIFYGTMWPLTLAVAILFFLWSKRPQTGLVRWLVTGQKND